MIPKAITSSVFGFAVCTCMLSLSASAAETEYVVIDKSARFYQAPSSDAVWFSRSMTPDDTARAHRLGTRFRWVGSPKPGWHEVRPVIVSDKAHCHGESSWLKALDINVFVRQSALQRVLTRDVTGQDKAGRAYVIHRGRWLDRGQPLIQIAGYRDTLRIPADAIGYRYTGEPTRREPTDYRYYPESNLLVKKNAWADGTVQNVLHIESLPNDEGKVLTLEARCVQFRKHMNTPSSLGDSGDSKQDLFHQIFGSQLADGGAEDITPSSKPEVVDARSKFISHTMKKGTEIFWPSGHKMGRLAADVQVIRVPNTDSKTLHCSAYMVACGLGVGSTDAKCHDPNTQPHAILCVRPAASR